jgi:hypothetical protein
MKHEGSLPYPQQPANDPYPELHESSSQISILFPQDPF